MSSVSASASLAFPPLINGDTGEVQPFFSVLQTEGDTTTSTTCYDKFFDSLNSCNYGNRCGHNPEAPILRLRKEDRLERGKGNHPSFLVDATKRFEKLYDHPDMFPALKVQRDRLFKDKRLRERVRRLRSEFREAMVRTVSVLLKYTSLVNFVVGWATAKCFELPTVAFLAYKAGLNVKRFERCLQLLRDAGYLITKQQRLLIDGEWEPCNGVRVFTKKFFKDLGFTNVRMNHQQAAAYKREKAKAARANVPIRTWLNVDQQRGRQGVVAVSEVVGNITDPTQSPEYTHMVATIMYEQGNNFNGADVHAEARRRLGIDDGGYTTEHDGVKF